MADVFSIQESVDNCTDRRRSYMGGIALFPERLAMRMISYNHESTALQRLRISPSFAECIVSD